MVNLGKKEVRQSDDGWTIITKDAQPSAHFEHTVAVRKGKADILSNHEMIIKALEGNQEVVNIMAKKSENLESQ